MITFVQSKTGTTGNSSATSVSATFDSNVSIGHLIIVAVYFGGFGDNDTVTDSLGNTYIQSSVTGHGATDGAQIWFCNSAYSGSCQVTATGDVSTYRAVVLHEYAGMATVTEDKSAGTSGTSSAPDSGSTSTTTTSNALALGVVSAGGTVTAAGSGYSNLTTTATYTGASFGMESKNADTTATYNATFTLSASDFWECSVLVLKGNLGMSTKSPGTAEDVSPLIDSYPSSNESSSVSGTYGQSFQASYTGNLVKAVFSVGRTGTPSGNIYAKLYAHSGTFGSTSVPTGSALATSDALTYSSINSGATADLIFTFSGANIYEITKDTYYVIVIDSTGLTTDMGNYIYIGYDSSSPAHAGNRSSYYSSSWHVQTGTDLIFYVYSDFPGTVAWSDPDYAKISDSNYAINAPAGTGLRENIIKLVKNGVVVGDNKSTGASFSETESYVSYGSTTDLWGTTWTASDINSSTFGLVFSAIATGETDYLKVSNFGFSIPSGSTIDGIFAEIQRLTDLGEIWVNHIRITVYYTPTFETFSKSVSVKASIKVTNTKDVSIKSNIKTTIGQNNSAKLNIISTSNKDDFIKSNNKTTYYSGCNYDWTPSYVDGKNRGFQN